MSHYTHGHENSVISGVQKHVPASLPCPIPDTTGQAHLTSSTLLMMAQDGWPLQREQTGL